jgi:hypothetical protein
VGASVSTFRPNCRCGAPFTHLKARLDEVYGGVHESLHKARGRRCCDERRAEGLRRGGEALREEANICIPVSRQTEACPDVRMLTLVGSAWRIRFSSPLTPGRRVSERGEHLITGDTNTTRPGVIAGPTEQH